MDQLSRVTFLVAESRPALGAAISKALSSLGAQTILAAATGLEALALLKKQRVDFVIAAWELKGLDGMALLKTMKQSPSLRRVPVILTASALTKAQAVEAGELGVDDVLLKPFSAQRLAERVRGVLEGVTDPRLEEARRLYKHGLALIKLGRLDEALKCLRKVIETNETAETYYHMGYIEAAKGRHYEAIYCFRKATELDKAFAQAHHRMAEVYLALGREKMARQAFDRAAAIYMDKGEYDQAERALKESARISPHTVEVYNSLGILYRRQGLFDQALAQYEKALAVNPEEENIYYNMARVYVMKKEMQEARNALVKVIELNPFHAKAQELMEAVDAGLA